MSIEFKCPCGWSLPVTSEMAGTAVFCEGCGKAVPIPPLGVLLHSAPTPPPPTKRIGLRRQRRPEHNPVNRCVIAVACSLVILFGAIAWAVVARPFDRSTEPPILVRAPENPPSPPRPIVSASTEEKREQARENRPVLLAWNPPAGQPLFLQMTTEAKQSITTLEKTTSESLKQTYHFRWSLEDQGRAARLSQVLEGCQLEMRSGIRAVQLDTRKRAESGPLADALVGAAFEARLDADKNVVEVRGDPDLFHKIANADPQLSGVFEASLSDEATRQTIEGLLQALPGREVKAGESWTRQRLVPTLLGGHFEANHTYALQGSSGNLHRIHVTSALTFRYPVTEPRADVRVKHAHLKPRLSGHFLFDSALGHIVSGEMNFHLEGIFQMEIAGEDSSVGVASSKKTTVRLERKSMIGN